MNESLHKLSMSHDQDGQATMAINNKNLKKNLLLQSLEVYDFETWHEASRNGGLQNLYKS